MNMPMFKEDCNMCDLQQFRPQALYYHINDVKSIFSGVIYVKGLLLFFMNGGLFPL